MVTTSIENQKMFIKYFMENKIFIYEPYIFNNDDIKTIYIANKEYYSQYNDIPTKEYIYDLTTVDKKIINMIYDFDIQTKNKQYLIDQLNEHVKKSQAQYSVSQIIDDIRNENWDSAYSLLANKFNPIVEDFTYEGKTQEEISKFYKMLAQQDIKECNKYLDKQLNLNEKYIINKYLLYPILKEKQLCMFFGVTGDGKTVLAVEIANCIAKGKCDWNGWYCECGEQNVCYIDFELGSSSFAGRYKNGKFSPNLHIINVNVHEYNNYIGWSNKQDVRIDRAIKYIEQKAKDTNSKIIFIDNLSNIADSVESAKEADRFISDLYGRMKTLGLTIIFLGHTPKIPIEQKIVLNHLKGSSSLTKTFESIIGFKRSAYKNISYIKQLKHRDLDLIYDEDNIAKFEFEDGKYGFEMNLIGTDEEQNMLIKKGYGDNNNARKYDNQIICDILYDKYELKLTIPELAVKYSINDRTIKEFNKYYSDNKYDLKNYYEEYKNNKIKNELF